MTSKAEASLAGHPFDTAHQQLATAKGVKPLNWILALPVTIVVVIFAVYNSGEVAIDLGPTGKQLSLPLHWLVLGSFFLGFLVGALIKWISGGRRHQHKVRELEREVRRLRRERTAPPVAGSRSAGSPPASQMKRSVLPIASKGP